MNDTCKEDGVEKIPHNSSGESKAAVKTKRKSTVEKGLEAVFDKFKNAANEDFDTRFAHSKWVIATLLKFRMRDVAISGCYLSYLTDDDVGYCGICVRNLDYWGYISLH